MPLLTGKTDDVETAMVPPKMSRTPGVIRLKVQDNWTDAASPMSSAVPLPPVSLNVGFGAVATPPTVGSWQLVAAASLRIWFWYFAWTSASPPPCHAVGLFGGEVGRDPAHALEVDPAQVDATEVERDDCQEQQDRQHDRELDEALTSAAMVAIAAVPVGGSQEAHRLIPGCGLEKVRPMLGVAPFTVP